MNNHTPPPTPEYDAKGAELYKEFEAASKVYAIAKHNARAQEDAEKGILADIIVRRQDEGAFEFRKLLAYGDSQFRKYLSEKHKAQHDVDDAWFRLEAARIAIELFRSRWSLKKTMIDEGM